VLADVRRDHLRDASALEQYPEAPVVDAAVVRDDGQPGDREPLERGDQILRDAAEAEAADDERRAGGHVRDGLVRTPDDLVDHRLDHSAHTLQPVTRPKDVVAELWTRFESRDWDGAAELLAEDVVVDWPHSRERLRGRANVVGFNRAYPEGWSIRVLRI